MPSKKAEGADSSPPREILTSLRVRVEEEGRRGERQSITSHSASGISSSTPLLLEQAAKED